MAEGSQVPAMPLSLVHTGETVLVSKVTGNMDLKRHLGNLGFVEGAEVGMVSSGSNMIVTVKGARFGIDTKVARHIMTVPAA